MEKPLIIIKLGGSVISYKDSSIAKARIEVINRLSKEIEQIIAQGNRLIIIHGAGSFGHPLAKQHNLVKGMKNDTQKLGYCLMVQNNLNLNSIIVSNLLKNNIPVVGLSPKAFVKTSQAKFEGFDDSIIRGYLDQGIIPILFGEGILDTFQGCSILSGDIILPYLATQLKAERAIFVSDVDGVYDCDPKKNPHAQLIPKITNQNLEEVLKGLTPNNKDDVSGEMKGKVLSIQKNLVGINVYIINGFKTKTLIKAVSGENIGTQLLF